MLPAAATRPSRMEARRLRGGVQWCCGRGGRSVSERNCERRSARKRFARSLNDRPVNVYLNIEPDNRRLSGGSQGESAACVAEAAASLVGVAGSGVVTVVVVNTGSGRRRRVDRARVEAGYFCQKQSYPRCAKDYGYSPERSELHRTESKCGSWCAPAENLSRSPRRQV